MHHSARTGAILPLPAGGVKPALRGSWGRRRGRTRPGRAGGSGRPRPRPVGILSPGPAPGVFPMTSYVTHLESALDSTRFPPGQVHTVHQGRPLWVRYDLERLRGAVTPQTFAARAPGLWRYRELLPLPLGEEPVTLGEGLT